MRHFNYLTRTEAVEGMHDLTDTVALPEDHWFFTLDEMPEGKKIIIRESGEPDLVDIE
ncbi:hypothetical protein VRB80_21055 [Erwinia aphidicola]|uniref:hypothetical protein n=1 Tax=Erwinia aphidicola TaxID=68334 RepID=UPI0030D1B9BD